MIHRKCFFDPIVVDMKFIDELQSGIIVESLDRWETSFEEPLGEISSTGFSGQVEVEESDVGSTSEGIDFVGHASGGPAGDNDLAIGLGEGKVLGLTSIRSEKLCRQDGGSYMDWT